VGKAKEILKFFESEHIFSLSEGYWEDWALKNTKSVQIVPLSEVDLDISPAFLKKQVSPNWCFLNAEQVLKTFPGTKYVLGFATFSKSGFDDSHVDHAWNSYKRKHFDVTQAVWNKSSFGKIVGEGVTGRYEMVIELNASQFQRLKNKVGSVSATLGDYYRYYVEPKER
jgi:hypothetical protein